MSSIAVRRTPRSSRNSRTGVCPYFAAHTNASARDRSPRRARDPRRHDLAGAALYDVQAAQPAATSTLSHARAARCERRVCFVEVKASVWVGVGTGQGLRECDTFRDRGARPPGGRARTARTFVLNWPWPTARSWSFLRVL
jgi:hypothetical protein